MRKEFARTHVTTKDRVAIVTLNDPNVLNATSLEMVDGLRDAFRYIDDPENKFRAAVLTGEGRGFSSGANLTGSAMSDKGIGSTLETCFHPLLRQIRNLKIPILSAVNGPAAGIGMSLALSSDLIYAARSAYFLQAFSRIGLVPDGGATWILPRVIGFARAKELSLLAEKLSAQKALEWGLINKVCDDDKLMDEALETATKLADGPTKSLSMIRTLFNESMNNSYEDQLDLEQRMQTSASLTEDFIEGVTAFLEKRKAHFTGE